MLLLPAGGLVSAGRKRGAASLVDGSRGGAIVSTGAVMVDQDFFEGLGFKHYVGSPTSDDHELMEAHIDRIYDTYIDEDELRICDRTIREIADELPPRPFSSREFINQMGHYLYENHRENESVVRLAYEKQLPIFVPAFSDSSAGFGLVEHQYHRAGQSMLSIDSARDFLELTKVKMTSQSTGLLIVGGGAPNNFSRDLTVAAELLAGEAEMHKYAIQITVADERDGGLSGSTLQEAHSWGKVETANEQMVFSEATLAFPLIAGYGYHQGSWQGRPERKFQAMLAEEQAE